jgi:hypothetical protein
VGSVAVGAVGVAKFSDVFPVPDGGELSAIGVVAGVVAMGIAVLWLTLATWRVGDPVFTSNDPAKMEDDARKIAAELYQEVAGTPSLDDWQRQVDDLETQARNQPPPEGKLLQDQADSKRLEIRATQARVGALVVRERAKNARRLMVLVPTLLLFVAGLSASALLADGAGRATRWAHLPGVAQGFFRTRGNPATGTYRTARHQPVVTTREAGWRRTPATVDSGRRCATRAASSSGSAARAGRSRSCRRGRCRSAPARAMGCRASSGR